MLTTLRKVQARLLSMSKTLAATVTAPVDAARPVAAENNDNYGGKHLERTCQSGAFLHSFPGA